MLRQMFEPFSPGEIRPLARKEYDRMVELGILGEDDKIELLRGQLVNKVSPIGWQHHAVVIWLNEVLVRAVDPAFEVRPQGPFAADEWSEPEPDLSVRRKTPELREHPSDLLLVIEISDSSLRKDRGIKLRIYAAANVPEYWIFDLVHDCVEVYTRPRGETYEHMETLRASDVLRPTHVPGVVIALADMPR
jgi:Uma2 family endonuclease